MYTVRKVRRNRYAAYHRERGRQVGRALGKWCCCLMVITTASCGVPPSEFLRNAQGHATEETVRAHLGPPTSEKTLEAGGKLWKYEYRITRPIPVCRDIPASDCVRGKFECTEYILRFNGEGALQDWQEQSC